MRTTCNRLAHLLVERRASRPATSNLDKQGPGSPPYNSSCGHDLTAHKSRVQTARSSRVGRALDNRPTVGKQRHFVRLAPELQHNRVVTNVAVRLKAVAQLHKVHRPLTLVNLHGIPATQRDVRPPFTRQM